MKDSNSNPKNTEKSQSDSVGKENSVASHPSSPLLESLKEGEGRASYLKRQGLAGILEYEEKQNGVKSTSQEKNNILPQFKRLQEDIDLHNKPSTLNRLSLEDLQYENKQKEVNWSSPDKDIVTTEFKRLQQGIDHHKNVVITYLTDVDPSNTDVETVIGVKQVEESLNWLETIDPEVGHQFRQELLLKHKDRFDREKIEAEGTESKGFVEENSENQVSQQQYGIVTEESSLIRASNGLGAYQYLFGGLLVLYVVNKIYEFVYNPKNRKKD